MKRIGLVALALFLVMTIWGGLLSNTASSQQVESRIYNLEADLNRLESRLDRIEGQLGQSRASPSPGAPTTPSQSPRSRRNLSQQERDRMFDRLATLAIELKEQINALQARVAKLEKR